MFFFDLLLEIVTTAGALRRSGAHAIAIPLLPELLNHGREALTFDFAGDQTFDQRNIDTHTVGDAIRSNLVSMELRNHANLLFMAQFTGA